jgi:YD repeat-containing protein
MPARVVTPPRGGRGGVLVRVDALPRRMLPVSAYRPASDWLGMYVDPLSGRSSGREGPTRLAPVDMPLASGPGSSPRGSVSNPERGRITPLRIAPPEIPEPDLPAILSSKAGTAPIKVPTTSSGTANPQTPHTAPGGPIAPAPTGTPGTSSTTSNLGPETTPASTHGLPFGGGIIASVDPGLLEIEGGDSGVALSSFTYFPLYTLDYNDGVVLFPGFAQFATPGGDEDLRAQVRDTTVSTYSWDTSGAPDAGMISGTNTYRLQFRWAQTPNTARLNTVTLTVTDNNSHSEVQTYTFWIPSYMGGSGSSAPAWPNVISPDLVRPGGAAFESHQVYVDANSGSLNTVFALPTYNPNIGPLVFQYDSVAADQRPLIVVHHPLDPTLAIPSKTSAQLTFNGSAGSTYFFNTSQFIAGDIVQFALQHDATALATNRYAYTATIADHRSSITTTTYSGTATVVKPTDQPSGALGTGWSLAQMDRLYPVTGGVIIDEGGGDSLWFATSGGGGAYTSPAGEFSTLVLSGSVYTRTFKDGTKQTFNSSGYQTALIDRNDLRVTFAYDGSNNLQTITDPYTKITTFAYSGGKLRTVTDTAARVTTFTHSSGKLTNVKFPDSAERDFTYDGSGRMTVLTDERDFATTIAYDSAYRVGTITGPDNSTQTFIPYQKRGYDTSGTSGSPAPATLLAEARAAHTDPRGNTWDLRPDWWGQGLTNQGTDPEGNVFTLDRDANGLATIMIDRLSRISTLTYDNKANPTSIRYPDGSIEQFTYNSFSQVTAHTDERNETTTANYDGEGNLTSVIDPLSNRTTLTYTANGRVETVKDARSNVTTYQYDSQDRLTTIVFPGMVYQKFAYDTAGRATTITDERNYVTTFAYDNRNRQTGITDALGNKTTVTYDSGGNATIQALPTPGGQTARTTTLAYDAMNRLTTITAPLSRVTVAGYDSGGNLIRVTDPLGRVTTLEYDTLGRQTVVIDPLTNRTTATYDAEGQVLTVADQLNRVTTISYTSRGWRSTVTDPLGQISTFTYTATGKAGSYSNPAWPTGYGYTYDDADRLTVVTDGLGHKTTTVYDEVGNTIARVDGNSNRTTFTYDARNRLETIKDALSHVVTLIYDEAGNRTAVVDPLENRTTTAYDALHRATTITDAEGGVITLVYDAASRQTVVVDPVANRTTFAYDAADRVTTMTDALGAVTYSYLCPSQLPTSEKGPRIGCWRRAA